MRKDQVDLVNAVVWIPESKTPNGVAEVPLTEIAVKAFRSQLEISGTGPWLFRVTAIRLATGRPSRTFGKRLCSELVFSTFGCTISVRPMLPSSVPAAWPMNGSRSYFVTGTSRRSRSTLR